MAQEVKGSGHSHSTRFILFHPSRQQTCKGGGSGLTAVGLLLFAYGKT
jgi:hypothetical protein